MATANLPKTETFTIEMRVLDLRKADQEEVRGPQIRQLQGLLNAWLSARPGPPQTLLEITGTAGRLTQQAVRKFQAEEGLLVDAIVGRRSWTRLLGA